MYKYRCFHHEVGMFIPQNWEGEAFKWLHEGQKVSIDINTGLKDDAGKDIFTSDKVEVLWLNNIFTGVVELKNGTFSIEFRGLHFELNKLDSIRVVGNYYEI